jgi:hypothetical protein
MDQLSRGDGLLAHPPVPLALPRLARHAHEEYSRSLFVFTEATSPKVGDLERDGRYMLHCTATVNSPWDLREFALEGTAGRVEDAETCAMANAGSAFARDERFLLFGLDVHAASSTLYGPDGRPRRRRWRPK